VNEERRASVSARSGCSRLEPTAIMPQRRPSTMIGVPTPERTPSPRAVTAPRSEASE
jgi:hypothetical protein